MIRGIWGFLFVREGTPCGHATETTVPVHYQNFLLLLKRKKK